MRPRRDYLIGAVLATVVAVGAFASPQAEAKPYFRGFAEAAFTSDVAADRTFWLDQAVRANSNIVRLNLPWRNVTAGQPVAPTNPADPAYDFGDLDDAVIDATARGQQILITVYDAPAFAQGPNPPGDAPAGTWKPDPAAIGDFAQAVATRYSGSFTPLTSLSPLPKVGYLEAWNESNLSEYITPQYVDGDTFAADHYREMLNGFYAGVKRSGNSEMKVVAGATAPYGDPIGGRRTRPLRFLREVFCLNGRLEASRCKDEAQFDILSHHPITLSGGPDRSALHPDDAAMPDIHNVIDTVRAAEKRNTVGGAKRHPVWATEFWWESKPPDNGSGVPLARHARWIEESLYSIWKQGAEAAIWLQLGDTALQDSNFGALQSGLFFVDRREKPAFTAFRFPFVADRVSKKKVNVWTVAPASGTLEIQEKRGNEFRTIDRMNVTGGKPDQQKIKAGGKTQLRGVVAGETSLAYGLGS